MTWVKISNDDKCNHSLYEKDSALFWVSRTICILSFGSALMSAQQMKDHNPLFLFPFLSFLATLFFRFKIFDRTGLIKSEKWIWIYILSFPFVELVLNSIYTFILISIYNLPSSGLGTEAAKYFIIRLFLAFFLIVIFIPYRFFSPVFRLQALNLIKE